MFSRLDGLRRGRIWRKSCAVDLETPVQARMHRLLSQLLLSLPLFTSVFGTDCQVSEWSAWSQCFGNCEVARSVRNRDVIVPPLPFPSSPGKRTTYNSCPYLYETRPCKPAYCNNQTSHEEDMPTPGPFPMESREIEKYQSTHKDKSAPEIKESGMKPNAKMWISHPEKKYFAVKTITEEKMTHASGEHSDDLINTSAIPEITTTPISKDQNFYINSLTLDLPMRPRMTMEVEKKLKDRFHIDKIKYRNFEPKNLFEVTTIEPELNEVFRHLERAAELNLPVDEKQIRAALKKNKKLVKALVEAYRARKDSRSSSTTTTTAATTSTQNLETTSTKELMITTTPKFWPRNGYVPNTKKHASDITSKLYMTKEIVQILHEDPEKKGKVKPNDECPENNRCCKVVRDICENGEKPQMVKRFYRPRGSPNCVAYNYPKCSQFAEMEEQPIQFLQNCQDLCFSASEKRISPLYILGQDY